LTSFANNEAACMANETKQFASESMATYASMNKELRAAEVDVEELEDAIQEAEDDGNQQKADHYNKDSMFGWHTM
jgi:hypothetical protein